jgi:DNA-directed RNA polymerase specialized sigma24 family protein
VSSRFVSDGFFFIAIRRWLLRACRRGGAVVKSKRVELPFPTQELAPLYRFALLLTGDNELAEQIVIAACGDCVGRIESFRTASSRTACLLNGIRERRLKIKRPPNSPNTVSAVQPAPVRDNGAVFAQKISALAEPERSALALFYLDVLPAREIAALLGLSLEDLAGALEKGRERLRREGLPDEKAMETAL